MMTPLSGLLKWPDVKKWESGLSLGTRDKGAGWFKKWLTAVTKKGISAQTPLPLSLWLSCFFSLRKTQAQKTEKCEAPVPSLQKWASGGQGFFVVVVVLNSYVCSCGPSPCSRLCICTCTSPACCSRWRSCCSGSDPKSTRPHLKEAKHSWKHSALRCECEKSSRHNSRIAKG